MPQNPSASQRFYLLFLLCFIIESMAWLWNSRQEYLDNVQPVLADSRGLFNLANHATTFEAESELCEALHAVTNALEALRQLGFTGRDNEVTPDDKALEDQAHRHVTELVYAGEKLLLYHKRLAQSDAAYGFLSQHDILEHWDRYCAADRALREIDQLVTDTNELVVGFYEIKNADEKFLTHQLDLPPELEIDFRVARNLFSVGFDDVAVFMAGRGLEGVLRSIARIRKLTITRKNQLQQACELDFFDLIELMSRVRWKRDGRSLIAPQTKALLHYLRALRNSTAHPNVSRVGTNLAPRELAKVVTETANQLWNDVNSTRARFTETNIQKNWA